MAQAGRIIEKAGSILRGGGAGALLRRTVRRIRRKRAERTYLARTRVSPEELERQRTAGFSAPMLISVACPLYNTAEGPLREMIASVQAQTYGDWELCLADGSDAEHGEVGRICREYAERDARIRYRKLEKNGGISENSNAALEMARGDYLALLDHDDLLTPDALYEARRAIDRTGAEFLYSDEMVFRGSRRDRPEVIRLKPAFSPDSLLANNYICHLTVFSRGLLERAGGFRKAYDGSQDYELFLRMTGKARGIAQIRRILYLWRSMPGSTASDIGEKQYAIEAGRRAAEDWLRTERGTEARAESSEIFPTMYRVRYEIPGNPSVRVILDAREETGDIEARIRALRESAGWENARWTVIGGAPAEGTERLEPREGESRRHLAARAAETAEEEYLLFISGVPEAAEEGWMRELLAQAQQPETGAVGGKILFADGGIRHTGVALGVGPAGLAGRVDFREPEDEEGYFGRNAVAQNVSAVTDCLMIRREKFERAGGFAPEY